MSPRDHNLTLKNPSAKENRWSRGVCQLIVPRCKTNCAEGPMVHRPGGPGRIKGRRHRQQSWHKPAPPSGASSGEDFGAAESPLTGVKATMRRMAQLEPKPCEELHLPQTMLERHEPAACQTQTSSSTVFPEGSCWY